LATERIVVTGATGFLGSRLVRVLLDRHPDARLTLLLREERGMKAADRAASLLRRLAIPQAERARVEAVGADVTVNRCGLGDADYRRVADGATRVIHSAATVRFDEDLETARRVNVEGTRNILEIAAAAQRSGALKSFTYIGTAYVAGKRTGVIREDELDAGQAFRNTYERTKFEAEQLVRARADSLPVSILRPSIIVGDSRTGVTSNFKMLYWPLKMYARRMWRTVPGFPDATVDIVPVDYVAAAVAHLAFDPRAVGRSVHICAGPGGRATIREIAERAAAFFGVRPPRYVNPALFFGVVRPLLIALLWGPKRRILRDGAVYRAYFSMRMTFDTAVSEDLLGRAGIRPPRVVDYLDTLLAYCRDSDWGRRAPAPVAE
jgi:thioester reductase-like protein